MKTLIVDDQYQDKAQVIAAELRLLGVEPDLVMSSKEALRKMKDCHYDLLILDLQLPDNIGDDPNPMGGVRLLEFLEINSSYQKPSSVIAITAHSDSYDACEGFFTARGWSIFLGLEDLERIKSVLVTRKMHVSKVCEKFDVAIITALAVPELEAVLALPCSWSKLSVRNDDGVYFSGEITNGSGKILKVIAANATHMGMAAAAALTTSIAIRFEPSLVIMTGIAAGIEGKTNLGDILVADPCWDWGSGKLTVRDGKVVFMNAPTQIALDSSIRKQFQYISANKLYASDIYAGWKNGPRPPNDPNVLLGPMATGAVVLEDPETVELIKSQHRNTIGVEMEAYGVMSAAYYYSGVNRPQAVAIKSVCDFANPEKNDSWQSYASYTSAQLAYKFIVNHFVFNDN
nr:hypothetical protein [uncultured Pseudomonas sp.]